MGGNSGSSSGGGEDMVWGIISTSCWDTLVVEQNITDAQCLTALAAKGLGMLMIVGSLVIKAPQVAKIVSSKSVDGLSPMSFYSEMVIYITMACYHLTRGSPFSAYGEILTILVQNVALVALLWRYQEKEERPSVGTRVGISAAFVALGALCLMVPPDYRIYLTYLIIPLMVLSKVPQIYKVWREKHTGQLAFVTCFLNAVGTLVRIVTTVVELGWAESGVLLQYALGAALNLAVIGQMLWYWRRTNEYVQRKAAKKEQ